MRKLSLLFLFTFSCFFIYSCKSKEVEVQPVETVQEPEDEVLFVDEIVDEPVIELIDEEPEEPEVDDAEYLRSTNALVEEVVTKQEFSDDKAEILRIINKLSEIMQVQDVEGWLSYLDPESIKYYSTPANIRKAQKKLPDKTIQLNGIGDYFKYVFIPSRKRSEVDEIRYISKTNIKAVKVKDDNSINVYYYFVKIDGKWLVHIPAL